MHNEQRTDNNDEHKNKLQDKVEWMEKSAQL